MSDRKPHRCSTDKYNKQPDGNKEIVGKYCHYCGIHGHIETSFEFMAKLLTANESLKKVDQKHKRDLLEKYHTEQRKKQERQLKCHTNMIKKLLDTGESRDGIEKVLETIADDSVEEENKDHESNDASPSDSE